MQKYTVAEKVVVDGPTLNGAVLMRLITILPLQLCNLPRDNHLCLLRHDSNLILGMKKNKQSTRV